MKTLTQRQQDGMPAPVATEMLSERRARLTNTFRKQCCRARARLFVTDVTAKAPEAKTARRFQSASLAQLGRWLRRSIARREIVQRRYLEVPNSDNPIVQACFDAARADISAIANRLDAIRDCAEDEIKRRAEQAESIVGFRRAHSTSVDFYPVDIADMCQ